MEPIGTLKILRRYPVKSMQGEDLASALVSFSGVTGDRVWAFVQKSKADEQNNFPWHSAREQHDLLLYKPKFAAPPKPSLSYPAQDAYAVTVTTPTGRTLRVDDPELKNELNQRAGYEVFLRFSEKSMTDARPVSIFGLDTVQALSAEVGRPVDHRQFRANLYVQWHDPKPYFEDTLVGKRLKIGDRLELEVVKKDPRCVIINLDPDTAEPHPEVLRTVAKGHKGCAGVYAAVLKDGVAAAGDQIYLI